MRVSTFSGSLCGVENTRRSGTANNGKSGQRGADARLKERVKEQCLSLTMPGVLCGLRGA